MNRETVFGYAKDMGIELDEIALDRFELLVQVPEIYVGDFGRHQFVLAVPALVLLRLPDGVGRKGAGAAEASFEGSTYFIIVSCVVYYPLHFYSELVAMLRFGGAHRVLAYLCSSIRSERAPRRVQESHIVRRVLSMADVLPVELLPEVHNLLVLVDSLEHGVVRVLSIV